MSEQGHSDQTTGEGPVDPATPDTSSGTAQPVEQQGEPPKSPDEESDEPREGGGYDKQEQGSEEDEGN